MGGYIRHMVEVGLILMVDVSKVNFCYMSKVTKFKLKK